MLKNTSFRKSTTFAIIASSLFLFGSILSLILFGIYDSFIEYFDYIIEQVGGRDYLEYVFEISFSELLSISYVVVMALNFLQFIIAVAMFIISLVVSKDGLMINYKFRKRNGLHIVYLIFLGLSFETAGTSLLGLTELSFFTTAASVLFIAAFILGIVGIVSSNKKQASFENYQKNSQYQNQFQEKLNFGRPEGVDETNVIDVKPEEETIVVEQETPVQEESERKVLSTEEIENIYSLLAKLEKEYKNNIIDEATYKRMKETILDNLRK